MKVKVWYVSFIIGAAMLGCGIEHLAANPNYQVLNYPCSFLVQNFSKSGSQLVVCPETEENAALMVEEGDLLVIFPLFDGELDEEIGYYFRYEREDGNHLSLSCDPEAPFKLLLNDRLISLIFNGDPEALSNLFQP